MSGLSNYPPGVTGREWEIAGPDADGEELQDCVPCTEEAENEQDYDGPPLQTMHEWFLFDGYKHSRCTVCDTEKEDEIDCGPDPDDQRELERDREWDDRDYWEGE